MGCDGNKRGKSGFEEDSVVDFERGLRRSFGAVDFASVDNSCVRYPGFACFLVFLFVCSLRFS